MGVLNGIANFFKREIELNREYYHSLYSENEDAQVEKLVDEYPSAAVSVPQNQGKDEFSVIYAYGHIVQISPEPKFGKNYYDILDRVRALTHIISDGKKYNLCNVRTVYSIAVPNYSEPKNDYKFGSFGTLEYLLMEKAFSCSTSNPKLGIAYLRKAVELMKVSDVDWDRRDFQRIVWRLNDFGAKNDAAELERWYNDNILTDEQKAELIFSGKLDKKLEYIHKEILTVKRVATEDMLQFTKMPYNLDCPIIKHIEHGSHPFAYMDLNDYNLNIAKLELERLDKYIIQARSYIPLLTREYHIDVAKVMFHQYNPNYGYTHLMCTPHTFTGKTSKYPLSLFFMSRGNIRTYSVNGELFYSEDGSWGKAIVNIGKAPADYSRPGTGWIFEFGVFDSEFILSSAATTLSPDEYGKPGSVYCCKQIIEEENARALNRAIFEWLQKHLPDDCPKSISGFSRMRNANSKTYQALVKKAEAAGFVFPETLDDVSKWPENQ